MHSISAWAIVILCPLKNLMFTRFSLPFSRSACNCRPKFKHFISDWFYPCSLFTVRKILIPSCRYQGLFRNIWNVRRRKLRLFCDWGLNHHYVRFSVRFERTTNFKYHMPKEPLEESDFRLCFHVTQVTFRKTKWPMRVMGYWCDSFDTSIT